MSLPGAKGHYCSLSSYQGETRQSPNVMTNHGRSVWGGGWCRITYPPSTFAHYCPVGLDPHWSERKAPDVKSYGGVSNAQLATLAHKAVETRMDSFAVVLDGVSGSLQVMHALAVGCINLMLVQWVRASGDHIRPHNAVNNIPSGAGVSFTKGPLCRYWRFPFQKGSCSSCGRWAHFKG